MSGRKRRNEATTPAATRKPRTTIAVSNELPPLLDGNEPSPLTDQSLEESSCGPEAESVGEQVFEHTEAPPSKDESNIIKKSDDAIPAPDQQPAAFTSARQLHLDGASLTDNRTSIRRKMDEIALLPFVESVTNSGGNTDATEIPVVYVEEEFSDPEVQRRIDLFCAQSGAKDLKNLALADPSEFEYGGKNNVVMMKETGRTAMFFLPGLVMKSDLVLNRNSKQMNLAVFNCLWPRAAAVIGSIYEQRSIFIPTFNLGVTFGTQRVVAANTRVGVGRSYGGRRGGDVNPVLTRDDEVPRYNGGSPFVLGRYKSLSTIPGELESGDAAAVVFTLTAYNLQSKKRPNGAPNDLGLVVSPNIHATIFLASADPRKQECTTQNEVWGIKGRPMELFVEGSSNDIDQVEGQEDDEGGERI